MRLNNGDVLMCWPLAVHRITAGWTYSDGSPHNAIDIGAAEGTPVFAAEAGIVDQVQYWDNKTTTGMQSYGNMIRLNHARYKNLRLQTRYAHLKSICVKNGQAVTEGQLIGYSGNTGHSFGGHLHFEVIYNGNRVHPLNWLDDDFYKSSSTVILGCYTSVKRENTVTTTGGTIQLKAGRWNIRKGPGTSYAVVKVVQGGGKLAYTAKTGDWYAVEGGYLSAMAVQTTGGTIQLKAGRWNIRKGPGTSYGVVKVVQGGSKLAYTAKTGDWYAVEGGYISATAAEAVL